MGRKDMQNEHTTDLACKSYITEVRADGRSAAASTRKKKRSECESSSDQRHTPLTNAIGRMKWQEDKQELENNMKPGKCVEKNNSKFFSSFP